MSQPYVLPTYQSNLNSAIRDVVVRMNSGQVLEAWETLKTLYAIAPDNVEEEVKEQYEAIQSYLRHIETRQYAGLDAMANQKGFQRRMQNYLYIANRDFLQALKSSLMKHGYLERRSKVAMSNVRQEEFETEKK